MSQLPYRLDRSLVIRARPATVFAFFTETPRWAAWWGAGSSIDPRPGGAMRIRHANGVEVSGEVLEVQPPERIVFTYGYATGSASPPGSTRVTIRLDTHADGTRLHLTHEFGSEAARDEHVQGWRFQLSLFSNLIANTVNAEAAATVDRWFAAWSEPDATRREAILAPLVTAAVRFHDRFSCIDGDDELRAHLAAVHRFMPGMRLERRGDIRHCQWQVLADWVALAGESQERGRGTNLFELDADGRLMAVTGFWAV